MNTIITLVTLLLGSWTMTFDESARTLKFSDASSGTEITGTIRFQSEGAEWTIGNSRDGAANRLTLIDPNDNAQGYIVFIPNGSEVRMMIEHRTRQFYSGTFSFDGEIAFAPDSFACRIIPPAEERVLPLAMGPADSEKNDSVFSPASDTALTIEGTGVRIESKGNGRYGLTFSGRIDNPSETLWSFRIEPDYFKNRYVPYYAPIDRSRTPTAPTGWLSWNTYFDKATAEDNLAEARLGKEYFQPFGMEYWEIESWQENSNELPVSKFSNMDLETNAEQFPLGMKKLAEDIRALGFKPGIWIPPYGTGNEKFYRAHKDWFLHDEAGNPISCWNGRYSMDPTHPEALENLRRIFDIASHDWGYDYFKVDGMSGPARSYMAHLYEAPEIRARFYDPGVPNPFELTAAKIREGIGPDKVLLACQGHFTGPEAKYADAARTGADIVGANQPVHWEGVRNQAARTINQIFVNNIVFFTDPDTLLVNDLEIEQARVSATIISLTGQLMFSGDKLAQMTPEKIRLVRQTLPVGDIRPMNIYPRFEMLPVWDLRIRRDFGTWDAVALFNWDSEEKTVGADLSELGLSADKTYIGEEFWTGSLLETVSGRLETTVPARGVRLIALHEKQERPQFLTSSRHLTQGGIDLAALAWDAESRTMTGTVRLVEHFPTTLRFYLPDGWRLDQTASEQANVEQANTEPINAEQAVSEQGLPAGVQISFAEENGGKIAAVTLCAEKSAPIPFTLKYRYEQTENSDETE